MTARVSWFSAAFLFVVLTTSVACGKKTSPQIPESPRPEAITAVKVITRDAVAFLSWLIPARNVEGKGLPLASVKQFRIYRAEMGHEKRNARYKLYAEINLANPSPAEVRDNTVFWSDRNLRYGQVYAYRVRTISARGGLSPLSDEVFATPLLSLTIPRGLSARGFDSSIQLSWAPVTTRMDGSRYKGFVGYNIYRGAEKGMHENLPLNKEPLRTNSYKDTAVANDRTYYYVVRSVDSPALPWKESLDSEEVYATPRDTTPPGKPTGLTVVPGVGRAFLTWNENNERDLAGYHVYRTGKSSVDYERLSDKVLTRTTFTDETAKQGAVYWYMITAVDMSGNESTGSEETQALIEKLR